MKKVAFHSILVAFSFFSFCWSGCVHEILTKNPASKSTLIVTRSGETSNLTWNSEIGKYYTMVYAGQMNARGSWQVVPGQLNMRGTGGNMSAVDHVPLGVNRVYQLQVTTVPFQSR